MAFAALRDSAQRPMTVLHIFPLLLAWTLLPGHVLSIVKCNTNQYCPRGWDVKRGVNYSAVTCDPMNLEKKCGQPYQCIASHCGINFCCVAEKKMEGIKRQQETEADIAEAEEEDRLEAEAERAKQAEQEAKRAKKKSKTAASKKVNTEAKPIQEVQSTKSQLETPTMDVNEEQAMKSEQLDDSTKSVHQIETPTSRDHSKTVKKQVPDQKQDVDAVVEDVKDEL